MTEGSNYGLMPVLEVNSVTTLSLAPAKTFLLLITQSFLLNKSLLKLAGIYVDQSQWISRVWKYTLNSEKNFVLRRKDCVTRHKNVCAGGYLVACLSRKICVVQDLSS